MNKKILIVTRNLPPLIGGMERLNWHIADELSEIHDVYLISHTAAKKIAPKNITFYAVPLSPLFLFLIFSFLQTLWICLVKRVDVLFAGSGLTAPIVVFWAKIFKKKSIVYIHGLDIQNDSRIYHNFWIPFIKAAHCIIVNSTPTKNLCIKKNISPNKISIIHPGVTFPAPTQDPKLTQNLKEKFNLNNKKTLISVGRLTERKGLNDFIRLALPQIIKAVPNTLLLIVGDTANHALNRNMQTSNELITIAKAHGMDNHLCFTGQVTDQELSNLFYLSSIHIFPVKHIPNDPEGFGMVAIEAAMHGIPTVAFATGGIIDAVKDGVSGYLIKDQDHQKIASTTINFLRNEISIDHVMCQNYAAKFSWSNMRVRLVNVINK